MSLLLTEDANLVPDTQFPPFFASSASSFALLPTPLLPEVQNGITLLPVKSWLSTKVQRILGAFANQMGYPMKTVS